MKELVSPICLPVGLTAMPIPTSDSSSRCGMRL